jgi:signal transduction histidine kinase
LKLNRLVKFLLIAIISKKNIRLPWESIRILTINGIACLLGIAYFTILLIKNSNSFDYDWLSLYAVATTLILFFANRSGYYGVTRVMWIVNALTIISCYYVTLENVTVYFHYITISTIIIIIFGYENRKTGLILACLSLILFVFISSALYYTYGFIELVKRVELVDFQINFGVCFLASGIIVFINVREKYFADLIFSQAQSHTVVLESRLKSNEQKYSLLAKASGAMLLEFDLINSRITADYPLFKFGNFRSPSITMDDLLGIIHKDDKSSFSRYHDAAFLKTPGSGWTAQFRMMTRSQEYNWVNATYFTDYSNTSKTLLVSIININDTKNVQEQISKQNKLLEKANVELDNFVYHTSHDIRSPICSIMGLTNLAKRTTDLKELQMYLALVDERAKALDRFVCSVMNYSNNVRDDFKISTISLKELTSEVLVELTHLLEGCNEPLSISFFPQENTLVFSDRDRLKIILSQLISNAITYRNPARMNVCVNIAVQEDESKTVLSISDNGIGIEDTYIDRVFDMFYRASEVAKGSGLGLYLVKEIVQKLNGEVSIESKVGVGTIVRITFSKSSSFSCFHMAEPSFDTQYLQRVS